MRYHASPRALIVLAALALPLTTACQSTASPSAAATPFHEQTSWVFRASEGYDALGLMNALGNDPFYTNYYLQSAFRFRRAMSDEGVAAAERLYTNKRRYGFILSAFTTMLASTGDDLTTAGIAARLADPGEVMRGYRATEYYRWVHGPLFRMVLRRDVVTVLEALVEAGFVDWWQTEAEPRLAQRCAELDREAASWNILPSVERRLGRPIDDDEVTVFIQAFAQPHAYRLTGATFVTDISYGDDVVVNHAIHELLHPPVDWGERSMRQVLRVLRRSDFVHGAYEAHDPVYGYNTWEGYVEENIVRFLDQLIAEELGVATLRSAERWIADDGGMHVLAAILTALADETGYRDSGGAVDAFLCEAFLEDPPTEERLVELYEIATATSLSDDDVRAIENADDED